MPMLKYRPIPSEYHGPHHITDIGSVERVVSHFGLIATRPGEGSVLISSQSDEHTHLLE